MRSAHFVGFPPERGIRLAAKLANRGVYAEPASQVPKTPEVDLLLVDGTARSQVLCALQGWGGRAPPYAVALLYPVDSLPQHGAGVFPPWVSLITAPGLELYVQEQLKLEFDAEPRPAPRAVGYTAADGAGGIVQVEVLGPSGLIFETGRTVRRHATATFFIPMGRRTPLAMRGTVVSHQLRLLGPSRCVASFMAATAPQRRALGCLLAGWS